ncbi:MAG: hypothetical protein M0000_05560 [Actinomycetota bacterium]|nr:hypothetical protein [Actinomycetota bacterium]
MVAVVGTTTPPGVVVVVLEGVLAAVVVVATKGTKGSRLPYAPENVVTVPAVVAVACGEDGNPVDGNVGAVLLDELKNFVAANRITTRSTTARMAKRNFEPVDSPRKKLCPFRWSLPASSGGINSVLS